MASAWGSSFGSAWGNAWGRVAVDQEAVGGGASANQKHREEWSRRMFAEIVGAQIEDRERRYRAISEQKEVKPTPARKQYKPIAFRRPDTSGFFLPTAGALVVADTPVLAEKKDSYLDRQTDEAFIMAMMMAME